MAKHPGVARHGRGFRGRTYRKLAEGGRQPKYTKTFARAADAAAALAELKHEEGLRSSRGGITVSGFRESWLGLAPRPKASTHVTYLSDTKGFADAHGGKLLSEVDVDMALAWARGHRSSVKSLRVMFNDAMRRGYAESNPFSELGLRTSRGRADIRPLSRAAVERLADAAIDVWGPGYGQTLRAMILVAAYTGVRPGELFALRAGDIDPARREATIERQLSHHTNEFTSPKNGLSRTIVFPDEALEAFRSLPRQIDVSREVFLTKNGRLFRGNSANYYWSPVRASVGRSNMQFYELRHFCASYLLNDGGLPAEDVAIQLGHTDGGALVRNLYGHRSEDQVRERIKQAMRTRNVVTLANSRLDASHEVADEGGDGPK